MKLERKREYKVSDSIDIQVEILPVPFKDLSERRGGESSAEIRRRVVVAREIQDLRFRDEPDVRCNAQMNSRLMRQWVRLTDESRDTILGWQPNL